MNSDFQSHWLAAMPYKSKKDFFENLYLKAIIDSYQYIAKTPDSENNIRDRIVYDLINRNPITKKWVDRDCLEINFEKWVMVSEEEKRRVDISFFWSLVGSFEIECKLLFQQESKNRPYLEDGLIRFIELKYSPKNNYAGMIGFVVSGDISTIYKSILSNTSNFHSCSQNTTLVNPSLNWEHSFVSFHKRINNSNIQIYHLLFPFQN